MMKGGTHELLLDVCARVLDVMLDFCVCYLLSLLLQPGVSSMCPPFVGFQFMPHWTGTLQQDCVQNGKIAQLLSPLIAIYAFGLVSQVEYNIGVNTDHAIAPL